MKNRGFTLIELLAVIVILGVIISITLPIVNRIIDDSKVKAFNTDVELMARAGENYFIENLSKLPTVNNQPVFVFLERLVTEGYIEQITTPGNENEVCIGYVTVTKTGTDVFTYEPYLKCGNRHETANYREYTEENLILYLPSTSAPQLLNGRNHWVDNISGRTAELINMAMTTTSGYDSLRKGYVFDGVNDYLRIPSNTIFNTLSNGTFTYSMWITNTNYSTRQTILSRTEPCNNPAHFEIFFESNRLYFTYYSDLDLTSVVHFTDPILTNGVSYNIVWAKRWGQLGVRVYLNGVLQTVYGDSAVRGTTFNLPIFIGARNGDGSTCRTDPFPTRFKNGIIHDVLIYNRILTESEINYNYLFGRAKNDL